MKIVIGSDHGGYNLKSKIVNWLNCQEIDFEDIGTFSDKSCNYPDYAHLVASKVYSKEKDRGILLCTTGQGMAITANKYPGIRAALCWDQKVTILARAHNDSNILCLPGAFISYKEAIEIIEVFIKTHFEGDRHIRRISLINPFNNNF